MMDLDLQYGVSKNTHSLPTNTQLYQWTQMALANQAPNTEVTLRIVDVHEMSQLNHQYRHKPGPTNVLSFPSELPKALNLPLLGDVIICADIVEQEALAQHKTIEAHWAHLVIHGMLHLIGYTHTDTQSAEKMETLESKLLISLGYSNPYLLANQL